MWLWVDRDTIAVLRKIVRKAENRALERAAVVADEYEDVDIWDNVASATARVADRIRALKDTK